MQQIWLLASAYDDSYFDCLSNQMSLMSHTAHRHDRQCEVDFDWLNFELMNNQFELQLISLHNLPKCYVLISWRHHDIIITSFYDVIKYESYLVDNGFEFLNMFDEFVIIILKDFNFFQFISKLSVFSFYPFHISFAHVLVLKSVRPVILSPEIPDFKKNGETILSDSRSFSFSIPTDWTSWFFCWVKIDIFTSSWGIVFTFYRSTQFWLAEKMWRILIGWPMRKKLDLFLFFKFAKSKKSILHLTTNEL